MVQMSNRPIQEVVAELKRQKDTRKDLIVDTNTLMAKPYLMPWDDSLQQERPPDKLVMSVPNMDNEGTTDYPLTDWAHGQIAEKMEIPWKYYERMLTTNNMRLLAQNINTWLPGQKRKMIRILDGHIRGFLSDRYRVIDNYDMVFIAMDEFMKVNAQIQRIDLTDTNLYIKAVTPKLEAEVRPGDIVQGGIVISNSVVGAGRFEVEQYVLRLRCINGMVIPEGYTRVHLGKRENKLGKIDWSDETKTIESALIWSQVRDTVKGMFSPEHFDEVVNRLKGNSETPVEKPVNAVENIVTHIGLTDATKDMILSAFLGEKDHTQWGMVNAITTAAKHIENPKDQISLETSATEIALMEPEKFTDLISMEQVKKKQNGGNGNQGRA